MYAFCAAIDKFLMSCLFKVQGDIPASLHRKQRYMRDIFYATASDRHGFNCPPPLNFCMRCWGGW